MLILSLCEYSVDIIMQTEYDHEFDCHVSETILEELREKWKKFIKNNSRKRLI